MITELQARSFKSWTDTGRLRLAPLTGLFGTNSSGKTAILQLLLMLKQTVESADRKRVLHTGDQRTYVDLGTFYDIIHRHEDPGALSFALSWTLPNALDIQDPESESSSRLFRINDLSFEAAIEGSGDRIAVSQFEYGFSQDGSPIRFGMERSSNRDQKYEVLQEGYDLRRSVGRPAVIAPTKCYGFPDQVNAAYQNAGFLADFVLAFEELFQGIYYLGPLREYPQRSYTWAGERPQGVGMRGDQAIPALLASRTGPKVSRGHGMWKRTVEWMVAYWLEKMELIHEFSLRPIAEYRKDYEVRVRRYRNGPEVLITDVGFGVSQILPVLTLCYYAPEHSTIILEQPEIHLHPAVQADLADVLIDAVKTRHIQIIVESHSEHLLRRLQRRIAEEQFNHEDAALYFCEMGVRGESRATPLSLDMFGNIANWPEGFFGDEMGEVVAMTEAAMHRQVASREA